MSSGMKTGIRTRPVLVREEIVAGVYKRADLFMTLEALEDPPKASRVESVKTDNGSVTFHFDDKGHVFRIAVIGYQLADNILDMMESAFG